MDTASVLISEIVLFSDRGQKCINALGKGPGGVSFVGRSSLSRRVLYLTFLIKFSFQFFSKKLQGI